MRRIIILIFLLLVGYDVIAQENLRYGKDCYSRALAGEHSGNNWGCQKLYNEALAPLQAAAKEGYGEACYLLGNMYLYGRGPGQNYTLAMRMYERGLEFGYDKGETELGVMYANGFGCTADQRKAFGYFQKSATQGIISGKFELARCYYHGFGTDVNFGKAFELFSGLAGIHYDYEDKRWISRQICMYLGDIYEYGRGVSVDYDKAVRNYEASEMPEFLFRAAQLIDRENLRLQLCPTGSYYSRTNYISKIDLLGKAIDKGLDDAEAYYLYVTWYREKNSYQSISDRLFKYMLKSAEKGYGPAQKVLGDWYKEGKGTPVNLMKSKEWYAKAKANGVEVPE